MFQQSAQHTGQAGSAGPASPSVAWTYSPNDGYGTEGAPPVVGSDGTVYVARTRTSAESLCPGVTDEETVIDALSPQGRPIWQWHDPCSSTFRSGMAVASNGTVYAIDGVDLVAIAPGGVTQWRTPINSEGEVTIGPDGTLYVQEQDATTYAIEPASGKVLWTYTPPAGGAFLVRGTPALSPNGSTIYAGSSSGVLSALSTSGELEWTLETGSGAIENTPAVGSDGTIYLTTTDGDLDAVTPSGALKWSYRTGSFFETTPAVGNDGLIIAGDDSGVLVAVKAATGALAWTFSAAGEPGSNGFYNSSALIDSGGTAYIQNEHEVLAIGEEGGVRWSLPESGSYGSSLALDSSAGHLYVVTRAGLVALSTSSIDRPEYVNWKLSGSLVDKKLAHAIAIPEGSTFNGSGELNTETGAGSISGALSVPPFTATLRLFGVLPMSLGMTLTEVGGLKGSLAASATVAGDEMLTAPVSLSIGVTSLSLLGLQISTSCKTEEPASLSLTDTLTREELLTTGWRFTGATTLTRFRCQGALGGVIAPVLTALLSGPENPFALALGAPSA